MRCVKVDSKFWPKQQLPFTETGRARGVRVWREGQGLEWGGLKLGCDFHVQMVGGQWRIGAGNLGVSLGWRHKCVS